jgi:hypothetical protein
VGGQEPGQSKEDHMEPFFRSGVFARLGRVMIFRNREGPGQALPALGGVRAVLLAITCSDNAQL